MSRFANGRATTNTRASNDINGSNFAVTNANNPRTELTKCDRACVRTIVSVAIRFNARQTN